MIELGTCENCVLPFPTDQLFWAPDGKIRFCDPCYRQIFRREPEPIGLCEICGKPAALLPDPSALGLIPSRICNACLDGTPEYHETMDLFRRLFDVQGEADEEAR